MSEYFRKYIKKEYYPRHYSQIKFKTFFTNCILNSLEKRQFQKNQQDDWDIYWCEKEFIPETLDKTRFQPNHKVNHFRNYYEICRKDLLIKNLKKFKRALEKQGKPQEANQYNFYPVTYNLPGEYGLFLQQFKKTKDKEKPIWIMKPISRSQGKGIFLFKNINEISQWGEISSQAQPYIVQRYIPDPLLIGGKKFDLRIYVLCTSYQPLTVYLNRSGFARFTHYRYDVTDINNNEIHLTNVAIQKLSDNYDEQRGGKWLVDKLRLYLYSRYGPQKTQQCFYNIQQNIIKTLCSVTKVMQNDKRCFQLYGFDILLDSSLKSWLIEVNGSPSMTANTPTDFNLKCGILDDVFTILDFEKLLTGEEEQVGGFDLIYKAKPIKFPGGKNISMLGCFNNRHQQMKKLAKSVALKFGVQKNKAKPETQQSTTSGNHNRKVGFNSAAKGKEVIRVKGGSTIQQVKLPRVTQNSLKVQTSSNQVISNKAKEIPTNNGNLKGSNTNNKISR